MLGRENYLVRRPFQHKIGYVISCILWLKAAIKSTRLLAWEGSLACYSPWDCKELDATELLNNNKWPEWQKFIFSQFGDWKSEMKVLVSLVSHEMYLLGLQMVTFFLCPHMAFSLGIHIFVVFPSSNDTSPAGLGPTYVTSFPLNYSFKGPMSTVTFCYIEG